MSCGEPHETDCTEVLDHLYEFLDQEMPDSDCTKFEAHFEECSPCLEKYGLEQAVKKLVKRCCGQDDVPDRPAGEGDGPHRPDPLGAGRARAGRDARRRSTASTCRSAAGARRPPRPAA